MELVVSYSLYSLLDVVVASFSQFATLNGEIYTGFMHSSFFITTSSSLADILNGKNRLFSHFLLQQGHEDLSIDLMDTLLIPSYRLHCTFLLDAIVASSFQNALLIGVSIRVVTSFCN